MSPADFAASLTLSIVLAARLFCCAGFDWSTAAAFPPACGAGDFDGSTFEASIFEVSPLELSDLTLSDSVACCEVSAREGRIEAGISSTSAATADAASDVIGKKGR